jgi:hypothetical protein
LSLRYVLLLLDKKIELKSDRLFTQMASNRLREAILFHVLS